MHRATMATGSRKKTVDKDKDLLSYLRQKSPNSDPIQRMSARHTSLVVGSMNSTGTTLIVGKNKVTSVSGSKVDHRSFTDPLVPLKPHKNGHTKSASHTHLDHSKADSSLLALPHISNANEQVQMTAWFHEPRNYEQEVMIDPGALPGLKEGNIYEISPLKKESITDDTKAKKFIFIAKEENILSKDNSTSGAATKAKPNFLISLLSNLQKLLDIPPRSTVLVRLIPDRTVVELDTVEVYLKDVNFSRDSQWSLSSSMVGTCCYIDQRVSFLGNRIGSIKSIFKDGRNKFSGYIGSNTNIIFRSESAKLVFLVQLSREMWHFEENGEIMFHKLVNTLFPKIFKRWRSNNSHHSITIVLFTSVDLTQTPWISLGGGERPSQCRDYYRVVVDQVSVFIWDKIMANLRLEFANFKRDILLHLHNEKAEIRGEPCPAVKSNLLEAINLSLTLVCDRFRNTDLRHTINHLVVISPGTGLFDVDYDDMLSTSKKMFSLDLALDIVCLSQPPLHTVPLFRYRDVHGKVCHCVPKWCDISFYSEASTQSLHWIPRCKIYELQMMGVMENEVSETQIDRLHFTEKIPITESMDIYDEKLFKPVNEKSNKAINSDDKLKPKALSTNSVATLSLMGGIEHLRKPAAAKTNVSMTSSSAVGTVSAINNSALSTLYHLNKNGDEVRGKLFNPLRDSLSGSPLLKTMGSPASLRNVTSRGSLPRVPTPEVSILSETPKPKMKSRLRQRDFEDANKSRGEKKHSAIELERTEREENNPYWMQVANPSKQSASGNAQCSRWADVFPPKAVRSMFKWRSLKAPAALPISTSLFPTSKQLETEYTFQIYVVTLNHENALELKTTRELMREMIRLRLAMGFQICHGDRVKRIEAERKPGGSPESMIKYFPAGDATGARIYLSLNDEIHRLFFDYNHTLNVQLYRKVKTENHQKISLGSRRKSEFDTALIRTRYADEYTQTKIQNPNPSSFNWNQFDQLVAGYDDEMNSVTKEYHKMKFVVMPGPMPGNAYNINNDKLSDEEIRVEGLRKLIAMIERGKYVRSEDVKTNRKKEEILPEISFYTGNLYDFLNEQAEYFDTSGTRPLNSLMVSDGLRFNTNIKLPSLATQLQGPGGLKLVDRTWHFKMHPHCFLGSEFVSWLIEAFEDIDSREEATSYGQSLMDKGLFCHVEQRHGFLDGHYFYEFNEEYADQSYKAKQPISGWFRKREGQDNASTGLAKTMTHTRENSEADLSASTSAETPLELRKVISQTWQPDSENSSLTDSQKLRKTKKFIISKHVKYNCDPLHKSFRPEVLDVHYDLVHNPDHCYHIRLQWLNTTTKFIDETIISWSRLCERYGLRLVETPWRELCTIPLLNPFHSFVDLNLAVNPLTDPEFENNDILKINKFYYHLHFLKKADFLLDNRGTSFFLRTNIEIRYSWGEPSFQYAQFIHKSGAYIVELRDNGNFFMAPNNVHILRVNTLTNVNVELSGKLNIFDSQKVMMDFRESCKDEKYLRSVFEEATQRFQKDYESDYLLGM